jgi:excisionase family DNA binding protein
MDENKSNTDFSPSEPETWSSFLTIAQVAKVLNVSPWTLRQWDNQGKLVALRIGNRKDRRYKKEDIVNILKNGI